MDRRDDTEAYRPLGRGALSPRYWAAAIELQRERLEADQRAIAHSAPGTAPRREAIRCLQIDAHFGLVAIRNLLRMVDQYTRVLKDAALSADRAAFTLAAGESKHFRDVLEHLDDYALGTGRLHERGELDPTAGLPTLSFQPPAPQEEVLLELGDWLLPLKATSTAAVKLGEIAVYVWEARFGPDTRPGTIFGAQPPS